MDDRQCEHCVDHADWKAEKAQQERKIEMICHDGKEMRAKLEGLAGLSTEVVYIRQSLMRIEQRLYHDFVTMNSFSPVRLAVFGLIGLITLTVFGALLGRLLQ